MKKPIAQVLVKGKFFIAPLFLCIVFANPCWAQVIPPVPPPTKAGCFSSGGAYMPCGSRWSDSYNGAPYNCFCDCSSWSVQDCVPVSGPNNANSGQGSIPYQTNPGDVSIHGPMNGNPFYSSHPSMSFEEWAAEFKQVLATLGINTIIGKNYTLPRIPMGKDQYSNAAYAIKAMTYEPKTKPVSSSSNAPVSNPPVNDPNVVDLKDKDGIVQLLTTEEEQRKRDEWDQANIKDQGYFGSINLSINEIQQEEPPLTDFDIVSLGQTAIDLNLKEGTFLKGVSTGAGTVLGAISYGSDLNDLYNNPNIGLNAKTLYQVSTVVADASLLVGGLTTVSTIVFGVAVGTVGTPVIIGAAVAMTAAKIYVWYNKPFGK